MNIKQTIRQTVLGGVLLFATVFSAALLPATPAMAAKCGGVDTAIINCDEKNENLIDKKDKNNVLVENTAIWALLIMTINILTAGVGVLALAGIVYGGILYASAGGNPEQVKKARTIFLNVAIGVIAFAGMFTVLNFLIPGGVFR